MVTPVSRLVSVGFVLLSLAATSAVSAQDTVVEGIDDHRSPVDGLVINLGIETNWGYLHPGAPGFERSMEAFGYDPIWAMFNLNAVGEVLFAFADMWEVGPHFGYNGLITHTGPGGRDFDLTAQEIGAAARLVLDKKSGSAGLAGFRIEGGYLRAVFTMDGEDEVSSTLFVRPAISMSTAGSGIEFTFGWTFAMVPDGFGTNDVLPLGGLDVGLLMRIAP